MSAQEKHESPPATESAIEGHATEPQPAPHQPETTSDNRMNDNDPGSTPEGTYREQDYGGESTHPPTEPEAG